ncbi:MarR family winged helix-turn-helix transcriptional regulator [Desulfofustis glycolicus]|uniref:MarR family transcriptional regulator, 2-MHQ and catechol-resistance regulon repressor n=1 Tax=Desulfofustis glycolicus DSM 9705 TaxID=1121409 RepID=A0A1M5YFV2_9BACT|nr:MarR family transcriptional regulator [Desulfofustis glycolicus]MCB2218609.1 MarR family transcriptional regulator [Desulfobulbaceae bacterium]SHI10842.1 MarR family transcriptional regulator, 2-MHQ and catechol-resistance regulon repressor [Desulfofustis glycolicus DSM 9705]
MTTNTPPLNQEAGANRFSQPGKPMQTGAHLRLLFGRANKAIEQVDRASISRTGLNVSDFAILEALLHKGPLPINTIGEKVLLTSGSMTTAANRLEKKGLVQRVRDPADGRSVQLHLTGAGQELIETAFLNHCANLELIFAVLAKNERAELARLLKKIGRQAQSMQLP